MNRTKLVRTGPIVQRPRHRQGDSMRATLCCGWVFILRKDWSQGRMENHIYLLLFNKSKWDFSGFWGGEGGGIVKSYCFSHLLVFLVCGRNVPGGKGWIQARRQNRKSLGVSRLFVLVTFVQSWPFPPGAFCSLLFLEIMFSITFLVLGFLAFPSLTFRLRMETPKTRFLAVWDGSWLDFWALRVAVGDPEAKKRLEKSRRLPEPQQKEDYSFQLLLKLIKS